MHKNQKILYENSKARKPSVKTIGHKISLNFIWRKGWPVLTENKQNVDWNNIKNWHVQKIPEISLKQIHSITKETLGNNRMNRKGSLAPL